MCARAFARREYAPWFKRKTQALQWAGLHMRARAFAHEFARREYRMKSELLIVLKLSAVTGICPEISSLWMILISECLVDNLIPFSRRVSAS